LLSEISAHDEISNTRLRDEVIDRARLDAWLVNYRARLQSEQSVDTERHAAMKRANPKYVLRNHLAETAIRKARDEQDFSEIETLRALLSQPFDEQPEHEAYAAAPPAWAMNLEVSCSS
jgi:serine/tyrosine/threonine adenylyltransferase